jgi:hypothetical protein
MTNVVLDTVLRASSYMYDRETQYRRFGYTIRAVVAAAAVAGIDFRWGSIYGSNGTYYDGLPENACNKPPLYIPAC